MQGSEERLLGRAGLGDRDAFRRLYDQTAARVLGVVVRMLGRGPQAHDVLQEAYAQIWKQADSFDPRQGSAINWMSAIARYRALDKLRGHHAARPAQSLMDLKEPQLTPRLVQERPGLAICLYEMPPGERRAILTAHLYGLSWAELAARLGESSETVREWVRRGIDRLREHLVR